MHQLFLFFHIDFFQKGNEDLLKGIKIDQRVFCDIFKNTLKFILILNSNWFREFLWLHYPLLYGNFIVPHYKVLNFPLKN